MSKPSTVERFEHHGILGTVIDIRVGGANLDVAEAVNEKIIAEIIRLEATFSAFAETSELCRWRGGGIAEPSAEFAELMGHVLGWQQRSSGRFNPLAGVLSSVWMASEKAGRLPNSADMRDLADTIQTPRFDLNESRPVVLGDCSAFNLNAIAKGFIVDRSLGSVQIPSGGWACVNAGGDLAHRGPESIKAGIENPFRPYDNELPLTVIELSNAALATSGDSRRGFEIKGQWFSHVIDPRTGWPVEHVKSVSVVAPDAMTADVLATIAGVMAPTEALGFLNDQREAEGLVVDDTGRTYATDYWGDLVATES